MRPDRDHMFDEDDQLRRDEEEARIRELKRQVEQSGGGMLSMEFDPLDAPPGVREQFWSSMLQYNKASWTSEWEQLRKQGVSLPPPEQLDDSAIAQKLGEIVEAMSRRHVFLEHTDHLSDRALYEQLYRETLHEAKKDLPPEAGAFFSYDLVSSGSEQDSETFLRFYADDATREEFREFYPDGLPPKQALPFDRDRHLPRAPDGPLIDDETPLDERWLQDATGEDPRGE